MKYQFSTPGTVAPGYPIIGPGAQVQVAYGPNGEVTRLHYAARRYSEGQTVAVISPSLASERVAHLFPGLNAQITPQLVYYAPPLSVGHGIESHPLVRLHRDGHGNQPRHAKRYPSSTSPRP